MYKKIYRNMCFIAVFTLVLSAITILSACYSSYNVRIKDEIKTESALAAELYESSGADSVKRASRSLLDKRISLINSDGKVIYDNNSDIDDMDNHSNRPEVISAKKTGTGEVQRYSATKGATLYYYAVKLSDGGVLRIASETHNILKIFLSAIVTVVFIAVLIYILAIIIAVRLTSNIVKPIEDIYSFDNENYEDAYEEIQPFLNRIARQNKRIKQQMQELSMTEQIRREFSANVSHELKTPLTAIHGYAQLINNGMAKKEDIPEFTTKIEKESERLIALIGDITKLSKLDENADDVKKEQVSLISLAFDVEKMLTDKITEKNIAFTVTGDAGNVMANKSQITELLYNLCENAVKYNRDGGSVNVIVSGRSVRVSDTGIGIPDEYIDRIFERFFRVDKSHSKKVSGTGLGLSIVKHIAIANDAKISVESKLGEGTSFTVTFSE